MATGLEGCLGARSTVRSYYVLHGETDSGPWNGIPVEESPLFPGAVRVRNLNADDVYEKFQVVVRRSPYELRYSDLHVWAVKPADMVSDIIGRLLADANVFTAVTRELGDTRPEYTLGGELHAIEIYDSNDVWFAHLNMTLTLTRFSTGERIWSFPFDQRKQVRDTEYSHAVRALSELLGAAIAESVKQLEEVAQKRANAAERALDHFEQADEGTPTTTTDTAKPERSRFEPRKTRTKPGARDVPPGLGPGESPDTATPTEEQPVYVPEAERTEVRKKH